MFRPSDVLAAGSIVAVGDRHARRTNGPSAIMAATISSSGLFNDRAIINLRDVPVRPTCGGTGR